MKARALPSLPYPARVFPKEALGGLVEDYVGLVAPESEADAGGLALSLLVSASATLGGGARFLRGRRVITPHLCAIFALPSALSFADVVGPTRDLEVVVAREGKSNPLQMVEIDARRIDRETFLTRCNSSTVEALMLTGNFEDSLQAMGRPNSLLKSQCQHMAHGAGADPKIAILAWIDRRYVLESPIKPGPQRALDRFLWCPVDQERVIAMPKALSSEDFGPIAKAYARAREHALKCDEMTFSPAASDVWRDRYRDLLADPVEGALQTSGDAHVIRLAMVYALLAASPTIEAEHLLAAFAVWEYCREGAAWLLGTQAEQALAHQVYDLLEREGPLTQTEVHAAFNRHKPAVRLNAALASLVTAGKIESETVTTAGRRRMTWRLA
jgi:hypothetical protein